MVEGDRPATANRMLEVKARALRFGYNIQQQREATMPPSNDQAAATQPVVARLSTDGVVAPSAGARSALETSAHGPIHQGAVEGEPRRSQRIANLPARAADLTPTAMQEQDSLKTINEYLEHSRALSRTRPPQKITTRWTLRKATRWKRLLQ